MHVHDVDVDLHSVLLCGITPSWRQSKPDFSVRWLPLGSERAFPCTSIYSLRKRSQLCGTSQTFLRQKMPSVAFNVDGRFHKHSSQALQMFLAK
eukprot:2735325-Rhodomonas_salina.3